MCNNTGMNYKRTNVTLNADTLEQIKKELNSRGMSLSLLVRYLLKNWLKDLKKVDIKEL